MNWTVVLAPDAQLIVVSVMKKHDSISVDAPNQRIQRTAPLTRETLGGERELNLSLGVFLVQLTWSGLLAADAQTVRCQENWR